MKATTVVLLFALIACVYTITPTCVATNYCMSCSDVTSGNCTGCFNYGTGSILARYLSSNACLTLRSASLDTNCLTYAPTSTTDVKTLNSCLTCKSGYVQVRVYSGALATGSMSTNWTSTTCTAASSTYVAISNCYSGATVYVTGTGITSDSYCPTCASGYQAGATENANFGGYTTCVSGNAITNCDVAMKAGTGYVSGSASTNYCSYCKTGYAVASTWTACSTYTTDSSCQALTSAGACSTCWTGYYFSASTCTLASSIVTFAGFAVVALLALF